LPSHFVLLPSKVKNAHRIEVTTKITGTTIHSSDESPDMYASIDAVSDRLSRKLRKFKERRAAGWHGGIKLGSAAMGEDDDDEDILTDALNSIEAVEGDDDDAMTAVMSEDPGKPEVTKIRSFDLSKPISMEEAIFALDYVDHDFYVYRDADSGEVNVVYKRNAGGIGLIQPEQ
jgi:putative sigma-54 modulation protein